VRRRRRVHPRAVGAPPVGRHLLSAERANAARCVRTGSYGTGGVRHDFTR